MSTTPTPSRHAHPAPATTLADDLGWWTELADTLSWTNASTYADTAPHEYVVLGRTAGLEREDFLRVGHLIRTRGVPGKFHGHTNIYLLTDTHRYWTMDPRVVDTDLVNRAPREATYGPQDAPDTTQAPELVAREADPFYDRLADRYDEMWTDPADLEENRAVRRLVTEHFGAYAPSLLDIGSGTGLLLDLRITSPQIYTAVDPSQGMLNELVLKHPSTAATLCCADTDLAWWTLPSYDLVASTFASASYLAPETYERMYERTAPGGLVLLMTYEPGWVPDYYTGVERTAALAQAEAAHWAAGAFTERHGGRHHRLGHFDVWQVAR